MTIRIREMIYVRLFSCALSLFKQDRIKSARPEEDQITTKATAQESFTPNGSDGETHQTVRHLIPYVGASRLG